MPRPGPSPATHGASPEEHARRVRRRLLLVPPVAAAIAALVLLRRPDLAFDGAWLLVVTVGGLPALEWAVGRLQRWVRSRERAARMSRAEGDRGRSHEVACVLLPVDATEADEQWARRHQGWAAPVSHLLAAEGATSAVVLGAAARTGHHRRAALDLVVAGVAPEPLTRTGARLARTLGREVHLTRAGAFAEDDRLMDAAGLGTRRLIARDAGIELPADRG